MFGIAKRNLDGPEDGHLRAGKDYIAAGMFVIPTGTFTLGLKFAGTWRFQIDETMGSSSRPGCPSPGPPDLGAVIQRGQPQRLCPAGPAVDRSEQGPLRLPLPRGVSGRFPSHDAQRRHVHVPGHRQSSRSPAEPPQGQIRLMYEAAVVAFMCREAGGLAVDETGTPVLDIQPENLTNGRPSMSAPGNWWRILPGF